MEGGGGGGGGWGKGVARYYAALWFEVFYLKLTT